jgi:hypothetical protein
MAGFIPAIHVFMQGKNVDARVILGSSPRTGTRAQTYWPLSQRSFFRSYFADAPRGMMK